MLERTAAAHEVGADRVDVDTDGKLKICEALAQPEQFVGRVRRVELTKLAPAHCCVQNG